VKPFPAVLVDTFEQPVRPMPVIVYQFLVYKGSPFAVVATPAGTFRKASLDELRWDEMTSDTPATDTFYQAVLVARDGRR
jgi:hypothetical protein